MISGSRPRAGTPGLRFRLQLFPCRFHLRSVRAREGCPFRPGGKGQHGLLPVVHPSKPVPALRGKARDLVLVEASQGVALGVVDSVRQVAAVKREGL